MFYRVLVAGVVFFWLWMTVLLVRLERNSGGENGLPVPLPYVWKLLFSHEEPSDLVLYAQQARLGSFHLQPSHLATDSESGGLPVQQLTTIGSFNLDLPGVGHQFVVLHSVMKFDLNNRLQRLELSAEFRESREKGSGITVDLDGRPEMGHWHYAVRRGATVLKENTGSITAMLDDPDLRALGIDPGGLAQMGQQQAAGTNVTAQHGHLRLNNDEIETFVVRIMQGESAELTVHLNQLGQILAVKTFAGYDLYDDAFSPHN